MNKELIRNQLIADRINKNTALWALANWTIRGDKFSFKGHLYLKDIIEDDHKEIAVKKSAQCGISEAMLIETTKKAIENKKSMYVFPNDALLGDFVNDRVNPQYKNNPSIRKHLSGATDNVRLKKFGYGSIYFRGAGLNEKALTGRARSVDADIIYLDEIDIMTPDARRKFQSRLGASEIKWMRYFSTPTIPGEGIDEIYDESDQRVWHIICDKCGDEQPLTWKDNMDKENIQVICRSCKKPLDRLKKGRWIPRYPGRKIHGYWINKLMCSRTDLEEMIERYKSRREVEVYEFWTSDMGLAYEQRGQKITDADLNKCKGRYDDQESGSHTVMGVDIGKLLHITVAELEKDGRLKYIHKQEIKIESGEGHPILDPLMDLYDVDLCIIDGNPEAFKSKEFHDKWYGRVYMNYYWPGDIQRTELYAIEEKETDDVGIVEVFHINRTQAGDLLYRYFNSRQCSIPEEWVLDKLYKDQMKRPTRIQKRGRDGNIYHHWENYEKDDHYFHSSLLCMIAGEIMKDRIGLVGSMSTGGQRDSVNYEGLTEEGEVDRHEEYKRRKEEEAKEIKEAKEYIVGIKKRDSMKDWW
jgi:hypothetical protein